MTPFDYFRLAPLGLRKHQAQWTPEIVAAALARRLNPVLILAIMDRESLCGAALSNKAPDGTGDGGNGLGLMQIDKNYHKSFAEVTFDGRRLWKDPAYNILTGATLLKNLFERFDGNLWPAIASYNRSEVKVRAVMETVPKGASDAEICAAVDVGTTHNNYASDVRRRMHEFTAAMAAATRKGGGNV